MPRPLDDKARTLFSPPNFVTVATVDPDGAPQASVVWARTDGDAILFSTVKGRRKHANLLRDPRINLTVFDIADPYVYAEVRGTATITDDADGALIDELSRAYTGNPWQEHGPAERVIVRVTAERLYTR
ncbi:PPOX class F420-dependent oxidoreductase [Actinomadura rugatobispora]|uniref:PPOX class F420-dependent oxidoreductase n=1 Tax=Actinomadura rugatobispora TaxID=1994 RepID=A0ABW1ABZ5_9ACTN|nr:PPOX class F420-dependent oxidoreductase [Actinomadura rugatobispora]